tara:strand:+ start:7197 stop:7757 length:561 start_codon:yes stop_codon:yes gene_type:complete
VRIISGKFKGRSIEFLKSKNTRPLKDSVKENIFNILNHSEKITVDLIKSKVLDLYSGIGSFGIECLSRGAQRVTFVEKDYVASNILKRNLIKVSAVDRAFIHNENIELFLQNNEKKKYDIFFLDPPFADKSFIEIIKTIKKKKIFSNDNLIVLHREKYTQDDLELYFQTLLVKIYGRSKVIFGKFN